MIFTDSLTIRFDNRKIFGQFCMALREDRVPYVLGSFLSIHLPQTRNLEELPSESQKLLIEFRDGGLKISKIYYVGRRTGPRLKTRTETLEALRRVMARLERKTSKN